MSSISGRTAYVLLSAVEEDLRSLVETYAGEDDPVQLLGAELVGAASARRVRDGLSGTVVHAVQLLPYLDFQDSYDVLMRIKTRLPDDLALGLRGLSGELQRVVGVRNRVAHNRPLDVDDLPAVVDFVASLIKIPGASWSRSREARAEIGSDPSFIFRAAASLIADPDAAVANNLPAPDFDETSLLGRKEERRQVMRAIRGAWPVISILGDGGIGKTALALQVCYDLVEMADCPFEAIVWVTAKNAQLTSTEIVRIETAIEDSLGLFASATAALGGTGDKDSAVDELLEVLEIFPTLLVLDNVETVLDERFPRFLRDIPAGSKVLITSRIGVKTENPFKLSGLSEDDATKLMRILARSRGIDLGELASTHDLSVWARRMSCHPAHIKWFIAGLQAGQAPERLLNDNGLVLDFCMSNVFEFLGEDARTALRAMMVVPGSHTLAELAFLTGFHSSRIQEVVLELTTTNFVKQVRGGASGTALELSDFARAYLRRTLELKPHERQQLTERQRQLYALGGGLQAAHESDPYAVDTIDIRGVGDYSAAKQLREALELAEGGNVDAGLRLCAEAAELAPGYHEAARVEAHLHEMSTNFGEAHEAYSRARDLAPEDPHVAYFFGSFLLRSGFDPSLGIRELQRAANLDRTSWFLHLQISDAHLNGGNPRLAMDAAVYALEKAEPLSEAKHLSAFMLLRACGFSVQACSGARNWAQVAEDTEFALNNSREVDDGDIGPGALDYMLWIEGMARPGADDSPDNYIAVRLSNLADELSKRRAQVDSEHSHRKIGVVENLIERGYGFIASGGEHYFFHASSLWDRRQFDSLEVGSILVFTPGPMPADGKPPAENVNWVG